MNDKYLQFEKVNDNVTELYIYGDIRKISIIENLFGDSPGRTDALSLKEKLEEVETPNLLVRINSYGGSVSEGLAIYSLLNTFKGNVTTIVDGFACSAASVIFMAGQKRVVPENGLLMIHNAFTNAEGDYNDLKKASEDLLKIQQPSVDIYCSKTGLSEEQIRNMMDEETWITSKEALSYGFATDIELEDRNHQMIESEFICKMVRKQKELEKTIEKLEKETKIHVENKNQEDFY